MTRFFLRRERILPGPLRILRQPEHRSSVTVPALALTSAAIAAGLLVMPQFSPRLSVDPTPQVEFADASGSEGAVSAEPATRIVSASIETPVAPTPAPPAPEPAAIRTTDPSSKPAAASSVFQLDLLPVLETDGTGLDAPVTPAVLATKPVAKPSTRRTAASRGASASGSPAQP